MKDINSFKIIFFLPITNTLHIRIFKSMSSCDELLLIKLVKMLFLRFIVYLRVA